MKFRKILFLLVLCSFPIGSPIAQETQRTLTNADIIKMAKSGISEQTIILMIQKTAPKFDTSPDALIELKREGVTDAVLNAMLSASSVTVTPADDAQQDCAQSLDAVLASVGTRDRIIAVHSIRWSGKRIVNSASGSSSSSVESVKVFPSNIYILLQQSTGQSTKAVLTPEFNYLSSGKMTTGIPVSTIKQLQSEMKLDPIHISQHRDQYGCVLQGTEQIGNHRTAKLKVTGEGVEALWNIDPTTGRLLRTILTNADSEQIDFSDWRQVDGIYVPFTRHVINGGVTTDVTVSEFKVNPVTDASLFQRPADRPAAALTLKVLQSESVPYVVQTNGGISTSCNISGSTNTTMNSSTYGNTTYGTATSTPNLQMSCKSSDNTIRWTHVLNAMFVEASDGNAYIIACDRAWRWSKCTPLKAGDTFLARRTDKGFLVQSLNGKSKEQEATYSVLQSKSLHE
jgi:hypothetical protein